MTTLLAWTFIFAVPLSAFVYAWFFKKVRKEYDGVVAMRYVSTMILFATCVAFGIWLLNLPA